ncbi:MAG: hypothetical protein AAFQ82_06065 [Myxococcota bacterium]
MSRPRSVRSSRGARRSRRSTGDLRSSILAWEIDPKIRRATGAISAEELEDLVREERTLLEYVATLEQHAQRLRDAPVASPTPFEEADTRVEPSLAERTESRVQTVVDRALHTGELRVPQTDELRLETRPDGASKPVLDLSPGPRELEPSLEETLESVVISRSASRKAAIVPQFAPAEPTNWEREKEGARRRASARRKKPEAPITNEPRPSIRFEHQDEPPCADPQWYAQVVSTTHQLYFEASRHAGTSVRGLRARARRAFGRLKRAFRPGRAHPFIDIPTPWYQDPRVLVGVSAGVFVLSLLLFAFA